jgi:hypothetical protein
MLFTDFKTFISLAVRASVGDCQRQDRIKMLYLLRPT